MVENLQVKSNWKEVKKKLKHNFNHLSDSDLALARKGKEHLLVKRLQQKFGNNEEEVIEILNRLSVS